MRAYSAWLLAMLLAGSTLVAAPSTHAAHQSVAHSGTPHCVFDHMQLWTAKGVCRPHARSYPPGLRGTVRRAIYDSILVFGVPYAVMLQIALCESGLNPYASNGTHFGLYQFAPMTFAQGAADLRQDVGITTRSYWNALDASYVAAYLFAVGQSPRWSCE